MPSKHINDVWNEGGRKAQKKIFQFFQRNREGRVLCPKCRFMSNQICKWLPSKEILSSFNLSTVKNLNLQPENCHKILKPPPNYSVIPKIIIKEFALTSTNSNSTPHPNFLLLTAFGKFYTQSIQIKLMRHFYKQAFI